MRFGETDPSGRNRDCHKRKPGGLMKIADNFLECGYVVLDVQLSTFLDSLRQDIVLAAAHDLDLTVPCTTYDDGQFLDTISIPPDRLNPIRLHLYRALNNLRSIRVRYFALAEGALEELVG